MVGDNKFVYEGGKNSIQLVSTIFTLGNLKHLALQKVDLFDQAQPVRQKQSMYLLSIQLPFSVFMDRVQLHYMS